MWSNKRRRGVCYMVGLLALGSALLQAQGNDPSFDPVLACPAYALGVGPRILIDEAHQNLHTSSGRYASFALVAVRDGYRVEPSTATFDTVAPPDDAILVIANARGLDKPEAAAFSAQEIRTLRTWVESGGRLLLIADHAPFGSASKALASALDVEMIDGHVRDTEHRATELPGPYFLEFTAENGLLGEHPILQGRSAREVIRRVVTFGGQALRSGEQAATLLRLGNAAEAVADPGDPSSLKATVGGLAQAIAVSAGKGRVVVVGEAGVFGAQLLTGEAAKRAGITGELRFGMNHPGTDDQQLLLNLLHWLSHLL